MRTRRFPSWVTAQGDCGLEGAAGREARTFRVGREKGRGHRFALGAAPAGKRPGPFLAGAPRRAEQLFEPAPGGEHAVGQAEFGATGGRGLLQAAPGLLVAILVARFGRLGLTLDERRVWKEWDSKCRCRWGRAQYKQK